MKRNKNIMGWEKVNESVPKETQIWFLLIKHVKAAILNMLKELKEIVLE